MNISFGHDAGEAFWTLAQAIPVGYTVALLPEGREPDHDGINPYIDVSFVGADIYGVAYHRLNERGEADTTTTYRRGWEDIGHIHIY